MRYHHHHHDHRPSLPPRPPPPTRQDQFGAWQLLIMETSAPRARAVTAPARGRAAGAVAFLPQRQSHLGRRALEICCLLACGFVVGLLLGIACGFVVGLLFGIVLCPDDCPLALPQSDDWRGTLGRRAAAWLGPGDTARSQPSSFPLHDSGIVLGGVQGLAYQHLCDVAPDG